MLIGCATLRGRRALFHDVATGAANKREVVDAKAVSSLRSSHEPKVLDGEDETARE